MAADPQVGDRLSYDGAVCTIRYIGEVTGTSGSWFGVEWDDPTRGKHDGSHKGVRYFACKSRSSTAASFVRPTRPAEAPRSFVQAIQEKYTAELVSSAAIRFSGKVAEEVGFEKIRKKQAQLSELKYVVLDGMCIASAYKDGDPSIIDTCPKLIELDLSRNLFQSLGAVIPICCELVSLRSLRLNGNRFQNILGDSALHSAEKSLESIKDLAVEETLMSWEEMCHFATRFPSLSNLVASTNQLSSLPVVHFSTLSSTLTSLNLEFNDFTSIADVASLAGLESLRNLHLKGNNISTIRRDSSEELPAFSPALQYLDVSYNKVGAWDFVDDLPLCFPGLMSLRFAHNPIYDNPDPEHTTNAKNVTEEAYMFTIGRLAKIKALNFGTISHSDRQDAEMFYLARIGKHLAAVPESEEAEVIKRHKRYAELCELYGSPVVNRRRQVNPAFLEARLVTLQFIFRPADQEETIFRTAKVPRSFDIYAVKGIAGKLFGVRPLSLRLTWETGEWDPVAGFDDEVDDSSEEDEEEKQAGTKELLEYAADREKDGTSGGQAGKWVKREVELQDGPRQLGFCVDGSEAKIRVEIR